MSQRVSGRPARGATKRCRPRTERPGPRRRPPARRRERSGACRPCGSSGDEVPQQPQLGRGEIEQLPATADRIRVVADSRSAAPPAGRARSARRSPGPARRCPGPARGSTRPTRGRPGPSGPARSCRCSRRSRCGFSGISRADPAVGSTGSASRRAGTGARTQPIAPGLFAAAELARHGVVARVARAPAGTAPPDPRHRDSAGDARAPRPRRVGRAGVGRVGPRAVRQGG